MRIEIKTNGKPTKDPDIKALYVLDRGIKMSTGRMRKANLDFVLAKYGYIAIDKTTINAAS